jgi:hypothetical protein
MQACEGGLHRPNVTPRWIRDQEAIHTARWLWQDLGKPVGSTAGRREAREKNKSKKLHKQERKKNNKLRKAVKDKKEKKAAENN